VDDKLFLTNIHRAGMRKLDLASQPTNRWVIQHQAYETKIANSKLIKNFHIL